MHVVVVTHGCCYPANSGARLRTLNLMVPLAADHQITYVCTTNQSCSERHSTSRFFKKKGVRAILVEARSTGQSRLSFIFQLLTSVFSKTPYSILRHRNRLIIDELEAIAKKESVDLWQLEWLSLVEDVQFLDGKKIYVAHDLTTLLWRRHHDASTNPMARWFARTQAQKMYNYEKKIVHLADVVVSVSVAERELMEDMFGARNIRVVENGVDPSYFRDVRPNPDSDRLLFLGALESRPNQDAVKQLIDNVMPKLRAAIPDCALVLVGRRPPKWMSDRVAQESGIELHADVPDVRTFMRDCKLMVVPMRIAGGSRIKILEALAASLPVVSTRIGAEGLSLQHGEHLIIVDDVSAMSETLIRLFHEDKYLTRLASHGRRAVCRSYDWLKLSKKLGDIWEDLSIVTSESSKL